MSSQLPVNEEPATRMEEELQDSERQIDESNRSRMDKMKSQVDWLKSQVSTLQRRMAAIMAYPELLADGVDFGESASDIVVAATRKRRRDEDEDHDDEPIVASEEELACMRANDRNFEMSFVRSESPVWIASRTARSETFGRDEEDDELPSKRQRSDDQESISDGWVSDEELYVGEPVWPSPMQERHKHVAAPVEVGEWSSYPSLMLENNERVTAPVEVGAWSQWPVSSAGMQSPGIFPENGLAQYLLPPLSRQEVFQAQFEGEMTGELLAEYPLAQDTIEGLPDLPSESAFAIQREGTQDISEGVENDSISYRTTPARESQWEEAEAVFADTTTEQSANLEDLAAYYERVASLARQPAVVQYVRKAFIDFSKHKEKHPDSNISSHEVQSKLKFMLEREAMAPVVQDWSSHPLPVALILAQQEAAEDKSADSREGSESGRSSDDSGNGWGYAASASDGDDPEYGSFLGFVDEEQEMPESASSGLSPVRSPQEDATAAADALRDRYIECANTWNTTTKRHTCGILHAMPWGRTEDAHLEEITALKERLVLQERYDRCAAQWPMFGSHNCELDGEDRSAEDLRTSHHSKVKSMQHRRDRYEACVVRWSIYGRHTCGVEGESESDRLQEIHLREC